MSLKELKNLAPWQWDSQTSKHPIGPGSLRDFEQVLSCGAWPHRAMVRSINSTANVLIGLACCRLIGCFKAGSTPLLRNRGLLQHKRDR